MIAGHYRRIEDCSSMAAYYDQFGPNTIIRTLENLGYDIESEPSENELREWYHFSDGSMLTIVNRYETFVDD